MSLESQVWLVRLADEVDQHISTRLLASTGLRVEHVESINELTMRLSDSAPRVVVADGGLSETDRFKLYSRLQRHADEAEIPVLYVGNGGSDLEPDALPALELGNGVTVQDIADIVREASTMATSNGTEPVETSDTVGAVDVSAVVENDGASGPPTADPVCSPEPVLAIEAEPLPEPTVVATALAQDAPAASTPVREPNAFEQLFGALVRRWWLALAVLGTVMVADVFYTATRERTYLARASLIISPSASVERGSLVYSVDSLGRGRIVGTYAEVLGSELVHREALERLGLPPSALGTVVTFKSSTVADTAVVQVTAESSSPELSADAANAAGQIGVERMIDLFPVYNLVFLSRATPPSTAYRPDVIRNLSLGLLIGILLASVAAYAADTADRKLRHRAGKAIADEKPAKQKKPDRGDSKKVTRAERLPVEPLPVGLPSTPVAAPVAAAVSVEDEPKKEPKKPWLAWGSRRAKPAATSPTASEGRSDASPVPSTALFKPVRVTAAPELESISPELRRVLDKEHDGGTTMAAPTAPIGGIKVAGSAPALASSLSKNQGQHVELKSKGTSFLGRIFKPRPKSNVEKSAELTSAQEMTTNRLARVMNDPSAGRRPVSRSSSDESNPDRGVSAVA